MLEVVAKIFRIQSSTKLDGIARQVVEESLEDVIQLVADSVEGMSLSEARGYVRARTTQIVRRHTRLAVSHSAHARPDWSAVIARLATERLVSLVLRNVGVGIPRQTDTRVAA